MSNFPIICACIGCPHERNCRCFCPICQSPEEIAKRATEIETFRIEQDRRTAEHRAKRGVKTRRRP